MKLFVALCLAAVAIAAPRQKRLTVGTIAVSSTSGGGSTGCVVTVCSFDFYNRDKLEL